jgi:hypothetical protein
MMEPERGVDVDEEANAALGMLAPEIITTSKLE